MNLNDLATGLGVTEAELPGTLDTLMADVQGDTATVSDAHPRFSQHVVLLSWAQDTWDDIDAQAEVATNDEALNKIARTVINRIKEA